MDTVTEDTHREKSSVVTESDFGVIQLQGKECQRLPTTTKSWETDMEQILHQRLQKEPTLLTS